MKCDIGLRILVKLHVRRHKLRMPAHTSCVHVLCCLQRTLPARRLLLQRNKMLHELVRNLSQHIPAKRSWVAPLLQTNGNTCICKRCMRKFADTHSGIF
jgi:hypothetical protein